MVIPFHPDPYLLAVQQPFYAALAGVGIGLALRHIVGRFHPTLRRIRGGKACRR